MCVILCVLLIFAICSAHMKFRFKKLSKLFAINHGKNSIYRTISVFLPLVNEVRVNGLEKEFNLQLGVQDSLTALIPNDNRNSLSVVVAPSGT